MNRRILPFSFVICGAILAYACSSKDETPVTAPPAEGGSADTSTPPLKDGEAPVDGEVPDGAVAVSSNPIEGIGAPTEVAILTSIFTDGPVWHTDGLYFSTYGSDGSLVKLTPPNSSSAIHAVGAGSYPIGNAFDPKTNTFVSCVTISGAKAGPNAIVRTPANAGTGTAGTPIALNFDAGGAGFDAPNDLVVRKDGTIYVTDPGYQTLDDNLPNNHIWRITPTNNVFETVIDGRPNGIALSPDEKTLYVSFTDPAIGNPTITKYTLATDGTMSAGTKFTDVATSPADSLDGLAVDSAGNVYAAVKNGVDVFKADGSAKWGHITTTKAITGVALGGTDKKTLYMTSAGGMLQVKVKVAGLE